MSQPEQYRLTVQVPNDRLPAAVRLRSALKNLLRAWGIKCTSIEEVKPPAATGGGADHMKLIDEFACRAMAALLQIGATEILTEHKGEGRREIEYADSPFYFGYWDSTEEDHRGVDAIAVHAYEVATAMVKYRKELIDDSPELFFEEATA
jgi:hypothetical protein